MARCSRAYQSDRVTALASKENSYHKRGLLAKEKPSMSGCRCVDQHPFSSDIASLKRSVHTYFTYIPDVSADLLSKPIKNNPGGKYQATAICEIEITTCKGGKWLRIYCGEHGDRIIKILTLLSLWWRGRYLRGVGSFCNTLLSSIRIKVLRILRLRTAGN